MNAPQLKQKKNKVSHQKRKLTRFFVQEMLYSFLSNQLNQATHKNIQEYINQHPDIKKEIKEIESALSYCKNLSKRKISKKLLEQIVDYETFYKKCKNFIYAKRWPKWAQWSFEALSLALIVAVGTGITLSFFIQKEPKQELASKNQNLKKIALDQSKAFLFNNQDFSPKKEDPKMNSKNQEEISQNEKGFSKENLQKTPLPLELEKPYPKTQTSKLSSKDQKYQKDQKKVAEKSKNNIRKSLTKLEKPSTLHSTSSPKSFNPPKTKNKKASTAQAPPLRGHVYKAFMRLENATAITPQIVKVIKGLKGKKAGRVQLGWIKKKGSYFHFSLPEENYDLLIEKLKTYGSVLIQKEVHKRVMPEGEIRLILWIEKSAKSLNLKG